MTATQCLLSVDEIGSYKNDQSTPKVMGVAHYVNGCGPWVHPPSPRHGTVPPAEYYSHSTYTQTTPPTLTMQ